MKNIGMTRPLDSVGRVLLPIELRLTMDLKEGDSMEIFVDGDKIILKKYERGCVFCGELEAGMFKSKQICFKCKEDIWN